MQITSRRVAEARADIIRLAYLLGSPRAPSFNAENFSKSLTKTKVVCG
jgi:hypothetical protein